MVPKMAHCDECGALRQIWRSYIRRINVHNTTKFGPNRPTFAKSYGHLKFLTPSGTCHVAGGATLWARVDDPLA